MKIKALHIKYSWAIRSCVIRPVFFPKETGLQYKIESDYSCSIFTSKKDEFTFNRVAKLKILVIEAVYWFKMVAWRYLRYQLPNRVKKKFIKNEHDLPF